MLMRFLPKKDLKYPYYTTQRLCIDYRELNSKTIADEHLISRVHETLDSLGRNTFFSVLYQGKAHHQGLWAKEAGKQQWFMERCLGGLISLESKKPWIAWAGTHCSVFSIRERHITRVCEQRKEGSDSGLWSDSGWTDILMTKSCHAMPAW